MFMIYSFLIKSGLQISVMWILSQAGSEGNKIADQLAKLETCLNPSKKISGPISRKCSILP